MVATEIGDVADDVYDVELAVADADVNVVVSIVVVRVADVVELLMQQCLNDQRPENHIDHCKQSAKLCDGCCCQR